MNDTEFLHWFDDAIEVCSDAARGEDTGWAQRLVKVLSTVTYADHERIAVAIELAREIRRVSPQC
jgi:hypothetical protein